MIQYFLANLKFELNIRRRSISTYIYFLMFFTIAALMGFAAGGAFNGVTVSFGFSNKVFFNSSVSLTGFLSLLSAFSLFITAPAFGQAIVKDYANQFDQIIYSAPGNRISFLAARFFAAFVFMFLVLTSMGLGIWFSTVLPFVLKTSITQNHLVNYLMPYLSIVLPNLFVFGSIFFLIATKTKKMAPVYITTILIFMGWLMSSSLLSEVDNKLIGSLLDPFGINAAMQTIKYWSADQQNSQLLGLQGYLLYNRLAWSGLGLLCFVLSLTSFKFASKVPKLKAKAATLAPALADFRPSIPAMKAPDYSFAKMFWRQIRFEYKQIFRSIYFQALVLAGVCYMVVAGQNIGHLLGTNTYPVTYMILDFIGGSFDLFLIIIITFFTGEVIWRDRDQKTQQIIDSYPVPNFVLISAKYLTLVSVVATLFLSVIICGVLIQAFSGYTNFELPLYIKHLYGVRLIAFVNIISLVFFLQVITNNKYVSHGLTILYYMIFTWGPSMGFEHRLYNYNSVPSVVFSDMNGYGHFLRPHFFFRTYWFSLGAFLMVAAYLLWQRGNLTGLKDRLRELKRRNTAPVKALLSITLIAFIGLGGFLFYNTNVLNVYTTSKDKEKRQVDYELKYAKYRYQPMPEIVGVVAHVDLFPEVPSANMKYVYRIKNTTKQPMEQIFVNTPDGHSPEVRFTLSFANEVSITFEDLELGVRIYKLTPPLAAGGETTMTYEGSYRSPGISNSPLGKNVIGNGTFFNQSAYSVSIGYQPDGEISENKTREKYKLSKRPRIAPINDIRELQLNALSGQSSWIDFEATISTLPEQIAIAPGYLQRTWEEGGRKYFSYKMDKKMLYFFSILSGRYQVKADKWNDVNIEIYYHPGHEYDLENMIQASKDTLEYFTKNFGPYQFSQYRVIEFPRYATFAQSFPNTIPFSEAVGFIAKVNPNDPKDVDYPYFVTAHELAHQWWGHQVLPAPVAGAPFLTESLAEYTALLVMEKKYGRIKMKRFLREEMNDYLSGRQQEDEYETPLSLSEGQSYLHYHKGSLALFSIKEYVGEDVLNGAIKTYLEKVKFKGPPFTTTDDFIKILQARVSPEQRLLVTDALEKIVIFENRPLAASYRKGGDNRYEVRLSVNSAKYYSDKEGKETPADFKQEFDIGVTDVKGEYLYLKKHKFTQGDNEFVIVVDKPPSKAGVDPLMYIIDRTPDENMIDVTKGENEVQKTAAF